MLLVRLRQALGLGMFAVAVLALTGCPSLGPRAEAPPSIDTAEALAHQGDQAGAARMYEALAGQNSGADRTEYLFRAARAYLAAHRSEDAARVLASTEPPLTPQQSAERPMLEVEIALARGQGAQAWQRIGTLPEPKTAPEAQRYLRLKEQAAFAAGRPADAVIAEIALERWLPTVQDLRQSRLGLLDLLRDASEHGTRIDPRSAPDATVRGWLELGPIAAAAARNPNGAVAGIDEWRARYPDHPASDLVRSELIGHATEQPALGEAHIALLLPLAGRQGTAASIVRDGFLTAYYQTPVAQRAPIHVYDTGDTGIAEAVARATQEGAQFIVGPLTREEVVAAAGLALRHPPILALNFLPADRPAPPAFYQFALSPEEEARLAARRILADGRRNGVAIVPAGDWGSRVLNAFSQELQAGGGNLFASASIETSLADYSDAITRVLRINDSDARHRRLESILGTKLEYEPRRRGDLDFIFAPAPANIERLLRPQLRFHFAGDVPTYATSDAFEADPRNNQELEGLMFPDMPWILGGELPDAVRSVVHDAWPNGGGPRLGRLFAFGFDAYRLATALRGNAGVTNLQLDGLTGHLTLDADRRVHRDLGWAQIHNGELRLLPAPTPGSPAAAQAAPATP
ncbi:MAG TPA: penicillin-binding protein activator [Steroidobacteraceae bacterium]|nr:penicillin-binding protein activator [Steroidobacteraceae bacterium]